MPARAANHTTRPRLIQAPIAVRERQADLRQWPHQQNLEADIDRDRGERSLDRRRRYRRARRTARSSLRISTKRKEADRIGRQCRAAADGVGRRERPAQEQRPHDQFGNHEEGDEAGNGQQERQLDRAILRVRAPASIAGREPARHFRQQHGADRDADHADRQLIDAVGVIERRDRAGRRESSR